MTENPYLSGQSAQYRNVRSTCDYSLNIIASPFVPKLNNFNSMNSPRTHGLDNPSFTTFNEPKNSAESNDYDMISISNTSPKAFNAVTPTLSHTTVGNSINIAEISVLSTSPGLRDSYTPTLSILRVKKCKSQTCKFLYHYFSCFMFSFIRNINEWSKL